MKPARELRFTHYATHQIGFHQRRRKEIFTARFPRGGVIHVAAKISAAALDEQRFQLSVAGRARVIEREGQSKRRVRMHAGANRIILLGKKREILFDERAGKGREITRPAPPVFIVPIAQLFRQL